MKSLQSVFGEIDASREEIIRTAVELVGYPALAPINGGTGEGAKADYIVSKLKGFDSVERIEFPDVTDPSVIRPNIIARKNGKGKGKGKGKNNGDQKEEESTTGKSIPVRGPVSIQFGISVSPVEVKSFQITKSVNNEANDGKKGSD